MFSTIHSRGKDLSPKRGLFGNVRIRLKTAGFRDSTPPNAHPHRRRVYFCDPEGNDWEFVQYYTQDPAERNDYDLPDLKGSLTE